MHTRKHRHHHFPTSTVDQRERLQSEIEYLQTRLDEIGHDGDCAYEKAMVRFFEQQMAERQAALGIAG